ncbi:mitotic checkpoint protein BUB3.3 [Primulina huaijiensis]|uniref:mitotic checkpoint protein BUB3.3 n=1 Tax=Primulina huaijiensis TaxID=1492673 RepID=UPI003CC7354C
MNGCCLNPKNQIQDAISRIRFSPFSNNLLVSSWDSNLRLYDVDKRELRLEAQTDGEALIDCCFESEAMAVSANSDGSVLRYDMHSGTSQRLGHHDDLATCVEYSEEICQIITGGLDKKVKFWDVRSSCSVGLLRNLYAEVESISLCGFHLLVALKSSVHKYDLRCFDRLLQAKELSWDINVKCVRSNADLEGFAVGSIDGRVDLEYLCKSNSKNEGYTFRCHPKDKKGSRHHVSVNDIAFNPAIYGAFITGDSDGHAIVWDVLSKKLLMELPRYPNSVASLAYNRDGQILAIASSFTYHEANEREEPPQIFVHQTDGTHSKR